MYTLYWLSCFWLKNRTIDCTHKCLYRFAWIRYRYFAIFWIWKHSKGFPPRNGSQKSDSFQNKALFQSNLHPNPSIVWNFMSYSIGNNWALPSSLYTIWSTESGLSFRPERFSESFVNKRIEFSIAIKFFCRKKIGDVGNHLFVRIRFRHIWNVFEW